MLVAVHYHRQILAKMHENIQGIPRYSFLLIPKLVFINYWSLKNITNSAKDLIATLLKKSKDSNCLSMVGELMA